MAHIVSSLDKAVATLATAVRSLATQRMVAIVAGLFRTAEPDDEGSVLDLM